jgi:hypothetical protein
MEHRRISVVSGLARCLLPGLLCAALAACATLDDGLAPSPQPLEGPVRISAEWLSQQPGEELSGCGFHLLDADYRPLPRLNGLRIKDGGDGSFSLSLTPGAPDDFYLYITYPSGERAFDRAQLAPQRAGEYLQLALPQRIEGVLVLGLARCAPWRGTRVAAGELCQLSFAPGAERTFRSASAVNEDPAGAVTLQIIKASPSGVQLEWDEINTGDYNNNGQVEIADITPIGMYFGQQVAQATVPAELQLVDGDSNGEINIADLTPIGRNFQRVIQGYSVYRALGASPPAGAFSPLGQPAVARTDVWDAASPGQRHQRLHYTYTAACVTGENHYLVRAWSGDGDLPAEGPPSTVVSYTAALGNLPPVWLVSVGLTSAVGSSGGIRIDFGAAEDPESGPVSYVLRYIEGAQLVGNPGTVSVTIPDGELGAAPPYSWELTGLTAGQLYSLNLRAQDAEGLSTSNSDQLQATAPLLASSSDWWPCLRGDPARSGSSQACTLTEPLKIDWTDNLEWYAAVSTINQPLFSSDGWLAVALGGSGGIQRFSLADGSPQGGWSTVNTGQGFAGALDGTLLADGAPGGIELFRISDNSADSRSGPGEVRAATLLLGDYLYTVDVAGTIACQLAESGEEIWSLTPQPPAPYYMAPAADAQYLYTARSDGRLDKLGLLDGAPAAHSELGVSPAGVALALDVQRQRVFLATAADRLVALHVSDLEIEQRWPVSSAEELPAAPCIVVYSSPPMVLALSSVPAIPDHYWRLDAYSLDGLSMLWSTSHESWLGAASVTAGQSRLFVLDHSEQLHVVDFNGVVRQSLFTVNEAHSDVALAPDRLAAVCYGTLFTLAAADSDGPPQWQGTTGLRAISGSLGTAPGTAELTLQWDYALDDNGEPVHYVIYYCADGPPLLDPPYTGTTLITGIPSTDVTHSYTIEGLDLDQRYYAAVRAYDGTWADSPNIDPNTNILATTPPWQRELLVLGDDLPSGEIYFMRGMLDPHGVIHLIYNDEADTHLTHVWGNTGSWQHESAGLEDWPAVAFSPSWDTANDRLTLGVSDNSGNLDVLSRTAADTYSAVHFDDALPVTNPQLSLVWGSTPALAYTQYISGVFPEFDEDYYWSSAPGGSWDPVAELDAANFSGRDLSLLLDPADNATPWLASQRGLLGAPNRLTPMQGSLHYTRGDGGGGFSAELVDAGANAPDSDCGKRCVQVLDSANLPCVAYLDLNSSASEPTGQIRYAHYDGNAWQLEAVHNFDLSFQPGSDQYTWGEISLALTTGGRPLIAYLGRRTLASGAGQPHVVVPYVWERDAAGQWQGHQLADGEFAFPNDREPCVLLLDHAGVWHFFFASTDAEPALAADTIVHLYRPVD